MSEEDRERALGICRDNGIRDPHAARLMFNAFVDGGHLPDSEVVRMFGDGGNANADEDGFAAFLKKLERAGELDDEAMAWLESQLRSRGRILKRNMESQLGRAVSWEEVAAEMDTQINNMRTPTMEYVDAEAVDDAGSEASYNYRERNIVYGNAIFDPEDESPVHERGHALLGRDGEDNYFEKNRQIANGTGYLVPQDEAIIRKRNELIRAGKFYNPSFNRQNFINENGMGFLKYLNDSQEMYNRRNETMKSNGFKGSRRLPIETIRKASGLGDRFLDIYSDEWLDFLFNDVAANSPEGDTYDGDPYSVEGANLAAYGGNIFGIGGGVMQGQSPYQAPQFMPERQAQQGGGVLITPEQQAAIDAEVARRKEEEERQKREAEAVAAAEALAQSNALQFAGVGADTQVAAPSGNTRVAPSYVEAHEVPIYPNMGGEGTVPMSEGRKAYWDNRRKQIAEYRRQAPRYTSNFTDDELWDEMQGYASFSDLPKEEQEKLVEALNKRFSIKKNKKTIREAKFTIDNINDILDTPLESIETVIDGVPSGTTLRDLGW